jgi:nucleoside-triphosphatase THEP1
MENLCAVPVPLLITVAQKGGGYIAAIKARPEKTLFTVTPTNRDELPGRILGLVEPERTL